MVCRWEAGEEKGEPRRGFLGIEKGLLSSWEASFLIGFDYIRSFGCAALAFCFVLFLSVSSSVICSFSVLLLLDSLSVSQVQENLYAGLP
jgi:hypothetical protein